LYIRISRYFSLLFLCIFLLAACSSNNIAQLPENDPELEAKIDAILERDNFNGSVLLAKEGRIRFSKGYGMADFDNQIPNTPTTRFRIGSLNKAFTSLIILQLEENKLLSVNDKINKYIPDYPNGDQITLEHLLTHTSGIPEYIGPEHISIIKNHHTPQELIALFQNRPLHFEPGSRFEYSNSNYILLGYVIEQVTGQSYKDYLEQNVLNPLKMNNSGYDNNSIDSKFHALGYTGSPDDYRLPIYQVDMSILYAAGAMYSTVEDLFLWDQALYSEGLAGKDTIKKLFSPYIDISADPFPTQYGYGWIVYGDKAGLVGHGGSTFGYTSILYRNLEEKSAVILLSNFDVDPTKIEQFARELHSLL